MSCKFFTKRFVTITFLLLSACSKEPPTCSDAATVSQAKKAILAQILKAEQNNILANIFIAITQDGLSKAMQNGLTEQEILDGMLFESPRALAFDEKIKKYSCDAQLSVSDKIKLTINYDSQLDDQGQPQVFVNKISEADLFVVDSGLMDTLSKNKAAHSQTVPQTPQTASPVPTH